MPKTDGMLIAAKKQTLHGVSVERLEENLVCKGSRKMNCIRLLIATVIPMLAVNIVRGDDCSCGGAASMAAPWSRSALCSANG